MWHPLNSFLCLPFFKLLVFLLAITALLAENDALRIPFELDTDLPTVTCRKCVQFWTSGDDNPYRCGPNSETCSGTACFMKQCKRCGLYQYISGCIKLSDWQLKYLQMARQRAELLNTRAGASMLCEDNANHTICICNRRDRCNDIHVRVPFSTYTGSLFRGILNVDSAINDFDGVLPRIQQPRHMFISHWYSSSPRKRPVQNWHYITLIVIYYALFVLNF